MAKFAFLAWMGTLIALFGSFAADSQCSEFLSNNDLRAITGAQWCEETYCLGCAVRPNGYGGCIGVNFCDKCQGGSGETAASIPPCAESWISYWGHRTGIFDSGLIGETNNMALLRYEVTCWTERACNAGVPMSWHQCNGDGCSTSNVSTNWCKTCTPGVFYGNEKLQHDECQPCTFYCD